MELQATGNQEIAQKEMVSKFVHDVADMEVRAFTLKEAASVCEREVQDKLNDAIKIKNSCVQELEWLKKRRFELLSQGPKKFCYKGKHLFSDEIDLVKDLLYDFRYSTVGEKVGAIFGSVALIPFLMIALPFYLIFLLLIKPFIVMKKNKENKRECEKNAQSAKIAYDMEIAELNTKIKSAEIAFKNTQDLYERENERAQVVNEKVKELRSASEDITGKIQKCYELNVIKPAYRNFVCVTILNEIFLNDKADTMRDAMLLCDEVLRHQEEIAGLNHIVEALNSIANYMREIKHTLDSISISVDMICKDVYSLADKQDELLKSQRRIAYATESLQKSADNTDFYIAQKRAGAL